MNKRLQHIGLAFFFVLCGLLKLTASIDSPADKENSLDSLLDSKKRLLVLNAYHEGFLWTDGIMKGIYSVFDTVDNLELFVEYMDSKRTADEEYFKNLSEIFKHKYWNTQFDAILSSDDHALDFLINYRDEIFGEVPLVFSGINDFHETRIENFSNVTGVYEAYDVQGTVEMMLDLHPETKRIYVIFDSTSSGDAFKDRFDRVKPFFNNRIDFIYLYGLAIDELVSGLEAIEEDALVIWAIYIRTKEGIALTTKESVNLATNYAPCPVYSVWDVVGEGVVGGKVVGSCSHGEHAAKFALDVLNGAEISGIPVTESSVSFKYDCQVLEKYGISEEDLPAGSTIINRSFSFFQEYKGLIFFTSVVFITLVVLVVVLVVLFRKSKKAEEEIKVRNSRLDKFSKTLRNTNIKLEEAKEKAEQSDKLKTTFLANLSHEIRTPMNGILGFSELLKDEGITTEEHSLYVSTIEKSGKRMLALIEDLVNISKIESGVEVLHNSEFSLNQLIQDLYLFFKPETDSKGLDLIKHTALSDEKCSIVADQQKLEQVLINLVKNAIKFTEKGHVEFGYAVEEGNLRFWVADTGHGIREEALGVIFERFRQAKDTTPFSSEEGIGLGLAISKAFVQLMGGKIGAESKVDEGSLFKFTIPYRAGTFNKKPPAPVKDSVGKLDEDRTILVADDDEVSFLLIRQTLAKENINLLQASNGLQALHLVESKPEIVLVLMDIKMPVMNGMDAIRHILKMKPSMPVVMQSAYVNDEDRDKAFKAGCVDYLSKPINAIELKKIINKHAGNNSRFGLHASRLKPPQQ